MYFSLSLFKARLCSSEGLAVLARPQHIAVPCSEQPFGGPDRNKEAGTGMKPSHQLGKAVISVIRGRKYSTNPLKHSPPPRAVGWDQKEPDLLGSASVPSCLGCQSFLMLPCVILGRFFPLLTLQTAAGTDVCLAKLVCLRDLLCPSPSLPRHLGSWKRFAQCLG